MYFELDIKLSVVIDVFDMVFNVVSAAGCGIMRMR